jgi:hypothetical protein
VRELLAYIATLPKQEEMFLIVNELRGLFEALKERDFIT